jgi:hypothetical protein
MKGNLNKLNSLEQQELQQELVKESKRILKMINYDKKRFFDELKSKFKKRDKEVKDTLPQFLSC